MARKNLKKRGAKVTRRPQLQRMRRNFASPIMAEAYDSHKTLRQNLAALGLAPDTNTEESVRLHAAARLGFDGGATFVDLDEVKALAASVIPTEVARKPANWMGDDEIAYLKRLVDK